MSNKQEEFKKLLKAINAYFQLAKDNPKALNKTHLKKIEELKAIKPVVIEVYKILESENDKPTHETCYMYLISDDQAPQKTDTYWFTNRTINKQVVDCSDPRAGKVIFSSVLYRQSLSQDELIRSTPPFAANTFSSGTRVNILEFLSMVGQASSTWQVFRKIRDFDGATSKTFQVHWNLTNTVNADGTHYEETNKTFFAKRKKQIEDFSNNITPCDTIDAKKTYLQFLLEFQERYQELSTDSELELEYRTFYTQTVVQEIANLQAVIDATNINTPQITALESDNSLNNKVFKITIGINAQTNQIAGRLYYVRNQELLPGQPAQPVKIEYHTEHVGDKDKLYVHINTEQASQIEDGFTKQLLAEAIRIMPTGSFAPGDTEAPLFGGPNQLHRNGSSTLKISSSIGISIPPWYSITDQNFVVTGTDQCNNATLFAADRVVSIIPNPNPANCLPSAIIYNGIIAANQNNGADILNGPNGTPPTLISDNGGGVNALPPTAIFEDNFTLAQIVAFFNANQGQTSYTTPLRWQRTPPPVPPANLTINLGYWVPNIVNPATALATLQPLINYLCYYPTATVFICGWLDFPTPSLDPRLPTPRSSYDAADAANPTGPTYRPRGIPNIIQIPVDYIWVKALTVRNFILANSSISPNQIQVPANASHPIINSRIVNNATLARRVTVQVTNFPTPPVINR